MQVYGPGPKQHVGALACRALLGMPWQRVWCLEGPDARAPLCSLTRLLTYWTKASFWKVTVSARMLKLCYAVIALVTRQKLSGQEMIQHGRQHAFFIWWYCICITVYTLGTDRTSVCMSCWRDGETFSLHSCQAYLP